MKKKISGIISIIVILYLIITGPIANFINNNSITNNASVINENHLNTNESKSTNTLVDTKSNKTTETNSKDFYSVSTKFDIKDIPEYNGEAYIYVNNNIPYFTEDEISTEEFAYFSDLDYLGRCGTCFMNVSSNTLSKEERGDISHIYPTGWEQEKYDNVDGGWLYNRCHLIANALGGPCGRDGEEEGLLEKDLITGTRYMNIEGMWQIEETVKYYIEENPNNHVLYRVTPIFKDNNLLASGVLMEAYSVEDNGSGIKLCIYCYNVEPGVEINYQTGESKLIYE